MEYFVSFVYQAKNGARFGNCVIRMKDSIENLKDINDMENKIKQEFKIDNACMINFQKIGDKDGM